MKINKKSYNSNTDIYYNDVKYLELSNIIISSLLENNKEVQASLKLIKDDKSKVYFVSYNKENYYIKFYDQIRLAKRIKNIFRGPESLRYFKVANSLLENNLNTAKPVLAIVKKTNLLFKKSILVSKELKGKSVLSFLNDNREKNTREIIICKTAKLFAKLINKGFVHQDPSPPNFLVNSTDNSIAMIDIDDIYYYSYIPKLVIIHMLARAQDRAIYDFSNSDWFLNRKERYLFIKTFVDVVNKEFDIIDLIKKVNQKTIKRFKKRGKLDLIINDPILKKIYRK